MINPESYQIPIKDCPIRGHATTKDWKGVIAESMRYPGRNHPRLGAWIVNTLAPVNADIYDPMCGVGGLELKIDFSKINSLQLSDWAYEGVKLCEQNIVNSKTKVYVHDISQRMFDTEVIPNFIMFSPPFRQAKSAGKGVKQRDIISDKKMAITETFKGGVLSDKVKFYEMMKNVYTNLYTTSTSDAKMHVILRNFIRNGVELDEVSEHIKVMIDTGWKIPTLYVRDLIHPTAFQAWKLKKNPDMPWIKYEYILEGVKICP